MLAKGADSSAQYTVEHPRSERAEQAHGAHLHFLHRRCGSGPGMNLSTGLKIPFHLGV